MTRFFDPLRCPICLATLPSRPLRCPACRVELTGSTVAELVTTLRRADSLVDRMRAQLPAQVPAQLPAQMPAQAPGPRPVDSPGAMVPRSGPPSGHPPARSWFAGRSVSVILLVLGALCVLAAGVVFVAVEWMILPLAIRVLILVVITASFGGFANLALVRGLQTTAEAMAVTASGMFVLDLVAARRGGLFGLGDLAEAPYEIVAGALLMAVAGACALAVRSRQRWLWSLDVAVACGMAASALGGLTIGVDEHPATSVTVTIVCSLLYLGWQRLRLPVAMWTAAALGALAWSMALGAGTGRAVDYGGTDLGRVASDWPALAVGLVAGLWLIRLSHPVWRRVAACVCLLPVLVVFEIVGWSHGWVVGTTVVLVGYVVAALASGHVPTVWSPAVGGSALVLGLSSVVGLLPTLMTLAARLELAVQGSWRGPGELPLQVTTQDVQPWLLPLVTVVVLSVLPQVTVDRHRPFFDRRLTAGAFVAALGVLPILLGASFWMSIAVLVAVATVLILAARLWHNDVLLLLGLLLLAALRVSAYYDDLADALAWTFVAVACLAWATVEVRVLVRAGFLAAAGLSALFAAAQWLTLVNAPRPFHGLAILVIGSLGLVASQGLPHRAMTRLVGEGISVTWVVAGLALAGRSPSHRAAELTVAGVAAGVTRYVSTDRRRAGWVGGLLLTVASWIRLADIDVQTVEWYTLPAATALLVYGYRRFRLDSGESTGSSLRCLGPGLALALSPSLLLVAREPVSWRGLAVGLASVALLALGVRGRLAAPFAFGAVATALVALREIWPVTASLPRWTLLFLVGGALLGTGMTWESRVKDARTAGSYVRGLR